MEVIGSRLGADAAYLSGIAMVLVDEPFPWVLQLVIGSDVLCTVALRVWDHSIYIILHCTRIGC